MDDGPESADEPSLVSINTMEIVVALLLLGVSAVVMFDSLRIGIGWKPSEGPAAGYFPFYIGLVMAVASLLTLFGAIRKLGRPAESFVSRAAAGRVLAVLLPTLGYVGLIHLAGIYVASALFIVVFMLYFGREGLLRSLLVGIGVPVALFFMFERWFLVPLPKGPLEALLGYA